MQSALLFYVPSAVSMDSSSGSNEASVSSTTSSAAPRDTDSVDSRIAERKNIPNEVMADGDTANDATAGE